VPIDHWHDIVGNPTLADAILDRVIHNAYRIDLAGESMQTAYARTIRLTQQPKEKIIPTTRRGAPQGGRHQIGSPAGFGSEKVAGFTLECMAGFVGIRNVIEIPL
jgi:IstB-like ATP binding protein